MNERTFVLETPYAKLAFEAESRGSAEIHIKAAGFRPGDYTLTEIPTEKPPKPSFLARLFRGLLP